MIINSICVCGAGTMGSGIAQAAAQSGFHTLLYELNPAVLEKARTGIDKNLQSLVGKENTRCREEKYCSGFILRMTSRPRLADVFIEAIVEKPEIKIALFKPAGGTEPQRIHLCHQHIFFIRFKRSLPVL